MAGKKKILILEDDNFSLKLYSNLLTEEGFEVIATPRADEIEKLIGAHSPDMFIIDLMLEGGSGFDVIETIRKNATSKKTPIMVLSNLGQDSDIEEAKKLGANKYMVKSNTKFEEVIAAVKKMI